ncbi:hypothetical protein BDV23DRAFT_178396 [Aspergillus alliaceus]|uniref:NAD(P)-binding protein n=1 Tax=Petromyces alliaceus TaxID=209559 RepID=A0A5N7CNQ3_PETAA|nr:hypothetical protein BDV23DRAFT_178396 [Aspergillus alliaceus]
MDSIRGVIQSNLFIQIANRPLGAQIQHTKALITGASSGVGRAIALRYAKEGAHIVCADLSPTARSLVQQEVKITAHDAMMKTGGQAIFAQTGVSEAKQMERAVQADEARFGRLDIMVNNAGIAIEVRTLARVNEADERAWSRICESIPSPYS